MKDVWMAAFGRGQEQKGFAEWCKTKFEMARVVSDHKAPDLFI